MADERSREPEIKVSQDGINTNFSLSPRLDQAPARPVGSVLRRSHHHHNRNHSIDTKDRTSPILGFGPLQSHDRLWSAADLTGTDHPVAASDATPSISLNALEPPRSLNGAYDPASGFSGPRPKSASALSVATPTAPTSANFYSSARKVSGGSHSSSSSSSSTGSASPDASISSESRRPHTRTADRFQANGTSHHLSEGSTRRTASPARTFSGAPISPRLQSTMSAHAGLAHARRASADLSPVPFRAPSPIFLPSTSPPAGPVNPDPQHSWDSVWPRSSTPDRADQLRRIGSISPVAGSPGRSSPSTLSDSMNLSHSPSASFDSSSPAAGSNTVLGRPQPRRPHELRSSSSSPILRISPAALRDAHDVSKSPRRSLEAARTEPIIKIGFSPPQTPATTGDASSLQSPANRVLSPATEAVPHVDAANALASHRSAPTWVPERAGSPSATFALDPRKRSSSVPMPHGLPLPPRTPSPKMSPTSPRSPFLELAGSAAAGPSGSNMGLSESPPKTRSFIAMPPRSGYELSDDPDDVGSEEDGSNSERESVGTNDEDLDGSEYEDEDINDADAIDGESEHSQTDDIQEAQEGHKELYSNSNGDVDVVPERPTLPKRPSLTRSGVVPPPINVVDHVRSPMDPVAQAEHSARALLAQKGSVGSTMLNFFRDEPTAQESQQLAIASDVQLADAVMPSALGLDAGDAQPLDAAMDEGFGPGEDGEEEDADDQDAGMGLEHTEDSLNTLERIFLYAKSDMAIHRVLVSQSLPEWIREVELNDAVEYIIPLLNGLATDELDVCAAFAPEIGRVMWFFFRNCPIAELADDSTDMQQNADDDQPERASRPRISLTTFTTLLCALLLNQNTVIAGATQQSLVHLFYRLDRRDLEMSKEELAERSDDEVRARQHEQDVESYVTHASGRDGQPVPHEDYHFDDQARSAVKTELLENVALALAHIHHGRGEAEAKLDEAAPSNETADGTNATGEAMDEDSAGVSETAKATAEESIGDAMDEEQESRATAASWSQGSHMFGHDSDGSASDVQIDEDEESAVARMASVSLLAALAADELIPREALIGRFAPEVLKLIDDGAFYVRKEVASSLGPLSRNMTTEQVKESVLPALQKAIQDRNWHVRQAACFSLPAVVGKLDEELRREQTLVMMRALVNDVSSQLRMAALEIIGEVIYMFHGSEAGVPEELIRFFLGEPFDGAPQQGDASLTFDKTSDPEGTEALFEEESAMLMDHDTELGVAAASRADHDALLASFGYDAGGHESSMLDAAPWEQNFRLNNYDPERPLVVAYNLPAVVLTLGASEWSRLKQAHAELTQSDKPKVRKSLAASLHEMAKMVGPEATRDDLLPAATRFVTDEDGEVRTAMFEHMDVFLTCLPQAGAEKMLWQLVSMWSSGSLRDWRLRERLALHIPSMAKQFLLSDEEGNLVSLMQLALADPISAVRDAGVQCVPHLYGAFAEHDQVIADGFLGMVSDLGDSTGYRLRVACLLCMGALVEAGMQRASCELLLVGRLEQMGDDAVVDVRIALSRTLGEMCRREELYASPQSRSEELKRLIAKLARDASDEVRQPVCGVLSEDEVARYAPQPRASEEAGRRKLVLGPADGGPHRPDGEGGLTNQFVDANGVEGHGNVFSMDDDEGGHEASKSSSEAEEAEGAEESSATTQSQSAQHLEKSRASIFGGAQREAEREFGSDWVNANRAAFFDYGEQDEEEDEEEEDEEDEEAGSGSDGMEGEGPGDEEPHHLLNVDRDSSGSGELIEHDGLNEAEEGESASSVADESMEETEGEDGLVLSSPQRGLEGGGARAGSGSGSDSPSRASGAAGGATGGSASGAKTADPFLAFVAGRRSEGRELGKLETAPKRSRLANGSAVAPERKADEGDDEGDGEGDGEGETLQSPNGDEAAKSSGDWSQLMGAASGAASGTSSTSSTSSTSRTPDEGAHEGAHEGASGEDDFVRV